MPTPPAAPLTIHTIKEEIRRRATERQARIARGEHDVPIHYAPLPMARLLDVLSQLEYRRDFLSLAVPPPSPSLSERCKRFFKQAVCTSLRWLLIRQVEFNTMALKHEHTAAELFSRTDQNQAEFMAALSALKLQIQTLTQRLVRLEADRTKSVAETPARPWMEMTERPEVYQAYLPYFREEKDLLIVDDEGVDFLKFLLAEGLAARAVESDAALAEDAREHELPVLHADGLDYLNGIADGSLGGIFLGRRLGCRPPRELDPFLGRCWGKLRKGACLLIETWNPLCLLADASLAHAAPYERATPVELLGFLLENTCFVIEDYLFSGPVSRDLECVAQAREGRSFDRKQYRAYAVIGRK
jgi:hypothetical protein